MLQAKSKKDKKDEETKEKRVRKMESRFESFATIQVDGQEWFKRYLWFLIWGNKGVIDQSDPAGY